MPDSLRQIMVMLSLPTIPQFYYTKSPSTILEYWSTYPGNFLQWARVNFTSTFGRLYSLTSLNPFESPLKQP